jgi:uncharacterized protein YycO
MHYEKHIIRNFPKNYPYWKKALANLMFFVFGTIIHHRKNLLNKHDIKRAKRLLKQGDIILVGGLRRLSSYVIRGPVTHSMIYLGHNRVIHAVADGVEIDHLYEIFCEYDTMMILRTVDHRLAPKTYHKKIKKLIEYTKSKIGKPYDFEFEPSKTKFYCTELLFYALEHAGINTGLQLVRKKMPLSPTQFISNHFHIIFLSHNLKLVNNEVKSMI